MRTRKKDIIELALAEDIDKGDLTVKWFTTEGAQASARIVARQSGVLAGVQVAAEVFKRVDDSLHVEERKSDGFAFSKGDVVLSVEGSAASILTAERTALNFIQRLSGIATITRTYVEAVRGTKAVILDTRKTTPGMRLLEKYAVRMGGGTNHRMSLSDAALIKDNHIAAAGGVVAAFSQVRAKFPNAPIEIEVDTLEQLKEVLPLKPDLVLLDNMSPEQCAEAVAITAGNCKLEASGGISLENAKSYALSGVDYLAIGALTHSAPVLDIGLDLRVE